MKRRIGAPNFHNRAATMKNRMPRDRREASKKVIGSSCVMPLAMVITL